MWARESACHDFMPKARAFDGIAQLFADLRARNLRIGLATSSQPDELQYYLGLLSIDESIDPYIDIMVCGADVSVEKPAPDLLLEAVSRISLPAPRCWTVGDTPYDAYAATTAQTVPIGTLTGGFTAETLRTAGCATTIAVATDLPGVLSGIEGSSAQSS